MGFLMNQEFQYRKEEKETIYICLTTAARAQVSSKLTQLIVETCGQDLNINGDKFNPDRLFTCWTNLCKYRLNYYWKFQLSLKVMRIILAPSTKLSVTYF